MVARFVSVADVWKSSIQSRRESEIERKRQYYPPQTLSLPWSCSSSLSGRQSPSLSLYFDQSQPRLRQGGFAVLACLPFSSSPKSTFNSSTRLYVSGLSFRTSEESLRNAFQNFGQLVEVNLVMDKIANRPRGFAFLQYVTQEESKRAIEGMHGKFLDGRVIFVEVAKPRSQLRQGTKQNTGHY
ncbi:hypothetical protein F0562_024058 [Nyssa sinensis]|uniref:RRM domain-containing protein n=1 Tax=Nyssa sinensis TaxID=561372 RepID=A0A5J5BJP7_9ASTE|nr:hypothetical protein F0562_024058 [Nyssa sinensis]